MNGAICRQRAAGSGVPGVTPGLSAPVLAVCLLAAAAPPPLAAQDVVTDSTAERVADFVPAPARGHAFALSIGEIMRGPELVGEPPEQLRWTDDGGWLYFRWRPGGGAWDEERDLYRVPAEGGEPEAVPEAERDSVEILLARGDVSPDRSRRVAAVRGDLYLVDRATLAVRRLTDTDRDERSPRFVAGGVAFRTGDDLYLLDPDRGTLRQLTDIRSGAPPDDEEDPEGREAFLEDQQRELFEHVRRVEAEEDSADARRERREAAEPEPLFVPDDERVAGLDIDPTGDFVLVDLRERSDDSDDTSVPEWVTGSGYTEVLDARSKVGEEPGARRLGLLRTATGEVTWLDPRPEDFEDTVRAWSRGWNDAGTHALIEARSDDDEHRFLFALEPADPELTLLDHEHDEAWIGGPCGYGCTGWLPGSSTVYFTGEATGWSHLYLVEADGSGRRALTTGDWEVRDVAIPEVAGSRDRFLLATGENSPFDRRVAWMPVHGGARRYLDFSAAPSGRFDVVPSPAGDRLAVVHSTASRPPELFLADGGARATDDGGGRGAVELERVTVSPTERWLDFPWIEPEIVRFEAEDGASVPARIYRPADLGAEPNGAGVIFVHGAGYLHNVHNWWSSYYREYMFHHFLAAAGYTVLDIDYRGSAGYGRDWRTAIHRHMGGRDLGDQVDGARYLVEHEGVAPDRVGIYGGSYGGFITLMALFTAGDTFRAGAALRSVTDWAHYNDGYTSNILNDPQEDPEAYRRSSPIYHAEKLRP
ncbi:MAG: prolyl oligopeptidase family serine peptidase, partial [Gemmatimonadota bacterium]